MLETIESGRAETSFLVVGEEVRIEMLDEAGASIFGAIEQTVTQTEKQAAKKAGDAI